MPKTRQGGEKKASKNTKKQPKIGFGRPVDDEIEIQFMRRLRGPKLQSINSESEFQLCLHEYEDSFALKKQASVGRNQQENLEKKLASERLEKKIAFVNHWFQEIDQSRFQSLWLNFSYGAKSWKFTEIRDKDDFPEYLFDDECDLSYAINCVLNSQNLEKTTLEPDELLYLEMICFSTRGQISHKVLSFFKANTAKICQAIEDLKVKVKTHFEATKKMEKEITDKERQRLLEKESQNINQIDKSLEKQKSEAILHQIDFNENKYNFPENIEEENAMEEEKGQVYSIIKDIKSDEKCEGYEEQIDMIQKTKNIKKKAGSKQKRGRPLKPKEKMVEEKKDQKKSSLDLIKKMLQHISWAYRYVYEEQHKKKLSYD